MLQITRIPLRFSLISAAIAIAFLADRAPLAQIVEPAPDPNQRQVFLVQQDLADCTNASVANTNSERVAGTVWVTRLHDGNTSVKVAITAKPNTTYHFFLKCVRQLTDIKTDDEGVANVSIAVPTNLFGKVFAFDMYPAGAPAGQKFQSAQVSF